MYKWRFKKTKYIKWLEEQGLLPDPYGEDAWADEINFHERKMPTNEGETTMTGYRVLAEWCDIREVKK